jgi:hypothetical protein
MSDARFWHKPDLQHPRRVGRLTAALPPVGAEWQVSDAFPTRFRSAL